MSAQTRKRYQCSLCGYAFLLAAEVAKINPYGMFRVDGVVVQPPLKCQDDLACQRRQQDGVGCA